MKRQGVILLIALFAACPAVAQQATNGTTASATITVQKSRFHWLAPKEMTNSTAIPKPVEGLDARAWTTVAGWHPDESGFASGETHEGGWCLFWIDLGSPPVIRLGRPGHQ